VGASNLWQAVLSVKQVLALEAFQSASLLTCHNTVLNREVRWVSVIEVPVEDFVRPHELVMSTAMGIGHDPELLTQFIREVSTAGAAALAIGIGPYTPTLPPEVVQIAEDVALPLIALPWEMRFSELSQAVLERLLHEQQTLLNQSFAVHLQFIQLILAGATLSKLTQVLARELQRPALVVDINGKVLVHTGPVEERLAVRIHNALSQIEEELTRKQSSPVHVMPDWQLILVVVQVAAQHCGYLITPLVHSSLSQIEQLTLEHASTAAALCFLQQKAAEEAEMRVRDDFVWTLATGNIPSLEHAITRGRLLGYDVERTYACAFGQTEPNEIGEKFTTEQLVRHILSLVDEQAKHKHLRTMTTSVSGTVFVFLEIRRTERGGEEIIQQVVKQLSLTYPEARISWGIGGVRHGFGNFQQSYQEARSACQVGMSMYGLGQITPVSKVAMYRTLLAVGRDPESCAYWERYIHPLQAYEQTKGVEILRTLEIYFANQGNVSETARQLHLHRQSLLYRLKRAEQLTDCNLADAQDRFALELGLLLYHMREVDEQRDVLHTQAKVYDRQRESSPLLE